MNEDDIRQAGDPVLREVAAPIEPADINSDRMQKIITQMKQALHATDDGVAIAAPQIGASVRIFVVHENALRDRADVPNADKIFINPKIISHSKKTLILDEGCLSVRHTYGEIERSTQVTIQALDENGDTFEMGAGGLLAQIFQHETDHLDGVLFLDKASNLREVPQDQNNHEQQ
ncbi:MAG: peptide deformylase [Candidatus Paceibacterota bacterium]